MINIKRTKQDTGQGNNLRLEVSINRVLHTELAIDQENIHKKVTQLAPLPIAEENGALFDIY